MQVAPLIASRCLGKKKRPWYECRKVAAIHCSLQLHDAVKSKEEKKKKGNKLDKFLTFGRTHKANKEQSPITITDRPQPTAQSQPVTPTTPTPNVEFENRGKSTTLQGSSNSTRILQSSPKAGLTRPTDLVESWKMSEELMQEMLAWESQKANYIQNVTPLLQAVGNSHYTTLHTQHA
jgi:hypothetical protein